MRIDLDAARAARLETEGDDHEVVAFGNSYAVPPEAPYEFARLLARGRTRDALAVAFGEDAWAEIVGHTRDFSREDFTHLVDALLDVWGFASQGESEASGGPSNDGGDSSRPTSNGSTESTSETSGEDS